MWHRRQMPFVYILRCSDKTLYVGHTDDLGVRERVHNEGFGARHTAARRPVRLVYSEGHDSMESVLARERQLKRWSAKKKESLIASDLSALKLLSRRRRP
jgi:predicted GIY-YIG superfamily endonuclease